MKDTDAPNQWQSATISSIALASNTIRRIGLRPSMWKPFKAGQHLEVRLTAEDGYQASRSYSIASPPDRKGEYELLIECLPGGEVSEFFHDGAVPGIEVEIRGPIGGHFVWEDEVRGPVLLFAGGSGIAPILSMIRHRLSLSSPPPTGLIYATRYAHDLVAFSELESMRRIDPTFSFEIFLSRETQPSKKWRNERFDPDAVTRLLSSFSGVEYLIYVCGSNRFAEAAISGLITAGVRPDVIRAERFGGG